MTRYEHSGLAKHYREREAAGRVKKRIGKTASRATPSSAKLVPYPKCFLCGQDAYGTADEIPPFRCRWCFNAVAMNEADGEL